MRSLYIIGGLALLAAPALAQAETPSAQAKQHKAIQKKGLKGATGTPSVNTTSSPMANAGNGAENPAGASSNSGGGLTSAGGNAGGNLRTDR